MSNDTNSAASVVLKYYLYQALGRSGFIYPIYVLYLLSNGLSYAEVGVIGSVQGVIIVAGEIPTGYVADRIGRRNSLLVAQLLFVASVVGMIVSESLPAFVVAFGLLSLGMTFTSGSADAWLYDTLKERLDEDRYTHVRGRGGAVGQWVMAATMIAGSLLYVLDPLYPFVAVVVIRMLTFFVVLSMPKNAQYADEGVKEAEGEKARDEDTGDDDVNGDEAEGEQAGDGRLTVSDALPIVRRKLTRPPLRSFVAYVALFSGATLAAGVFTQPITVDVLETTVGPFLASVGVPEAASLGVLYASFTVVSGVASDHASDLEEALGVRKTVLVVPGVTTLALIAPALVPVLAFPMFFVLRASRSLLRPITGQYVNDRIESAGRATVLSVVSMAYGVVRIPLTVASGVVADWFSPLVAVAALGGTFLVGGSALYLWRPPVERDRREGTVESAPSD